MLQPPRFTAAEPNACVAVCQPLGQITREHTHAHTHTHTRTRTHTNTHTHTYSEMRTLDLSGNMLVFDAAIINIAHGCPHLSSLKCMMMPALSGCLPPSTLFLNFHFACIALLSVSVSTSAFASAFFIRICIAGVFDAVEGAKSMNRAVHVTQISGHLSKCLGQSALSCGS
jgi:hypothetical protein